MKKKFKILLFKIRNDIENSENPENVRNWEKSD